MSVIIKNQFLISLLVVLLGTAILFSCTTGNRTVRDVMDEKVTALYKTKTEDELLSLTYDQAKSLFTEADMKILASRHWTFNVNVPVVVSVMRSVKQEIVPFWLTENGFQKTNFTVKNEMTDYEIWQKEFGAGMVGLGINGFENYGLHYFVCVKPQNEKDELVLSNFFPANQFVGEMKDGAFVYHDWDELVLTGVPDELKDQKLLTTIRGRGTESHLVGAFRKTNYPSSSQPDQVMLTWSSDPKTSIDIQWRTNTTVSASVVFYREKGSSELSSVEAVKYKMEDLLLMNDRFIHRFTAHLRNLKPGTVYDYKFTPDSEWNEKYTFSTESVTDSFSYIWFGDTHYSPLFGELFNKADSAHPDAAFYTIAGDLVSDGLYRNQWDDLFKYPENIISRKPLMSIPGNHDNRAGLGALMFREFFSYPKNGPEGVPSEQTYSFTYKNALFLMLDATSPIEAQTPWIEEQLKSTGATWKFAVFHFPPYNWEEPYYNIQKAWIPLFDKYHVDMVFSGHIHYYMRSKPMKGGEVVDSYNNGTAYIISIAIPSRTREASEEPYAEVRKTVGQFYQYLKIEGKKLTYSAIDSENKVIDTFRIEK
ncbi:MAG TPA: metallophosphoesterase family protein [Draconibacterium sp.]|nr:metallophosphoesterase family protein [Draconibacterium sp.]